jgi:DNA-directed RNA polymerase subunit N (RpoN/RPB10)
MKLPKHSKIRYPTSTLTGVLVDCAHRTAYMEFQILTAIKAIIAQISHTYTSLFPPVKKEGRPLAIALKDTFAYALYKRCSTRVTKKSVCDDLGLHTICSYKTFVESVNCMGPIALKLLFILMRTGRQYAHLLKLKTSKRTLTQHSPTHRP